MAVITLKQLLHRTSPGAAIGPSNPLEVRQYGGDGQPISPATAGGQTAITQAIASLESTLGTETTLQLVKGMLDTISGKVATETTLGSVKSAVESIAGEDFATQTTLAQVLAALTSVKDSDGIKKIADAVTVSGLETLATESTLGGVKTAAETLAGTVADGAQKVTLTGSLVAVPTRTRFSLNVPFTEWFTSETSLRRIIGTNVRINNSSSAGNGFLPLDVRGLKRLIIIVHNTSDGGTLSDFAVSLYGTLGPVNAVSNALVRSIPMDVDTVPAGGTLMLTIDDLPKIALGAVGIGIRFYPRTTSGDEPELIWHILGERVGVAS